MEIQVYIVPDLLGIARLVYLIEASVHLVLKRLIRLPTPSCSMDLYTLNCSWIDVLGMYVQPNMHVHLRKDAHIHVLSCSIDCVPLDSLQENKKQYEHEHSDHCACCLPAARRMRSSTGTITADHLAHRLLGAHPACRTPSAHSILYPSSVHPP